jgi:hypothetical protein
VDGQVVEVQGVQYKIMFDLAMAAAWSLSHI